MDSVSGVGVLDKAVALLHALEDRGALGLADLQAAVGLPRATTHARPLQSKNIYMLECDTTQRDMESGASTRIEAR